MTSSAHRSASRSLLRDLCHALTGDYGSVFFLVDERDGEAEPSGKENGEAILLPPTKTPTSSSPSTLNALDDLDDLDALDARDDDRALTSRCHRRTRHRLRARLATSSNPNLNRNDSGEQQQLSAIASLGATAAFLEAAARVLTSNGSSSSSSSGTAAAAAATEACAFGWELSCLLEEYRDCVLELEARVSEEEEEAAAAAAAARGNNNGDKATASSCSCPSSLPLPVPRIRLHLGEWPVVLEEVAALAELALESMDEEAEEEAAGGEKKKRKPPAAVPPAAALARAAAALSRCGAPRVEAAAGRLSAAIESAQLLALSRWCSRGEGPPTASAAAAGAGAGGGGAARGSPSWVSPRGGAEGGAEDPFSSFELVPVALPPFLSYEAARDALFVGCAARAFSSRGGRRGGGEGDGGDGAKEEEEEEEETRPALLSLLSSNAAAPGDDGRRLPATKETMTTPKIRPTAVASALAAARERAERRLFRLAAFPRDASSSSPLRAALESLRRVALLGDAALWGTALRSGHLRAALLLPPPLPERRAAERTGRGGGGGGGGRRKSVSSALEAAADDARGAATPAALGALFSPEAPLRLSLVLLEEEEDEDQQPERAGRGSVRGGEEEGEEALWSRLRVRRREGEAAAAAWPLGLLSPLFSPPPRGRGEAGSSGSRSRSSSPSDARRDPFWATVDSLSRPLLALERASLSLEGAYLALRRSAAREGRPRTLPASFSSSSSSCAAAVAAAGNGGGGGDEHAAAPLLALWRALRDASFAVRGALSHLREDVLAPADRELDEALLRLIQGAGGAGGGGARGAGPWTLAAAALGRWRSRVASSSLCYPPSSSSSSSSSSSGPVAEALGKLCGACHSIRRAVELASFLEGGAGGEEEDGEDSGTARPLAAAKASALLGAAAAAGEAARALAAAAAAEASSEVPSVDDDDADDDGDDFAATHRAMLLGRVSFG